MVAPTLGMLWQNTTTGDRSIWVMNGTSYTSAVILSNVPTAWSIAGTGDFNADGNSDVVWQNTSTGDRSIWFMNGNGYLSAVLLPNVPIQWSIAGVGDFNADGKPDLVWQNTLTGDRSIWFMNGSTYSSAALLPNVPIVWKIVAVGDFNADIKSDLVWQNATTGESSIWFMNGATWSGAFALLSNVPVMWRIAAAADFDGDAKPDLVWQNINTGERSIWLMNGSSYGSAAILSTVPPEWSIAGVLSAAPLTPSAPSNLTAIADYGGFVRLAWADNSTIETGFRIEQCIGVGCTNFVEIGTVAANQTAEPITGGLSELTYSYRIRAYNAAGNSTYSNTASAKPKARRLRISNNTPTSLLLKDIVRLKVATNVGAFGSADLLSDDRFTTCQSLDDFSWIASDGITWSYDETVGPNYSILLAMGVWQSDYGSCSTIPYVWSRRTWFYQTTGGPAYYVYVALNITNHNSGDVYYNVAGSYLNGSLKVTVSQAGVVWGTHQFTVSQF